MTGVKAIVIRSVECVIDGSDAHTVPEPALEFAALSTKAASDKKPKTLQCSISAVAEDEVEEEELRPLPEEENLQTFQRSLLVSWQER